MWYWWLFLFSAEISLSLVKRDCANINCEHNDVNVCGVHADGSKLVSFRWFQDECAMQKAECEEAGIKGFRSVDIQFCHQAFSLNTKTNISFDVKNSAPEDINTNTEIVMTETTYTTLTPPCIQCDCNIISKPICAIRAESGRFIVRSFADECHMIQFGCENNVNFTITDDFICFNDKPAFDDAEETDRENKTGDTENVELFYETDSYEKPHNIKCIQNQCDEDSEEVCAVRPEGDRFIIRWFSDKCHMLQYNCDRRVNFTVIEDALCAKFDNETQTIEIEDTMEFSGILDDKSSDDAALGKEDTNELKDTKETAIASSNKESYTLAEGSASNRTYPNNVVVSTFDINENINQTVEKFFAASHLSGIPLQRLEGDTRRMLVRDTGPVNVFVPRAFIPANYTPAENQKQDKRYPEYSPLVKYCYHKCPEKCPDFYRPVCGARIDNKKQTPFVFFKNHCYMDIAKCKMSWAGLKGYNFTDLEEMGFIFCGGYKMMNMMYMYPLVRILQKMGRLKKKGRVHFVLRNMGQFPIPLQG